MSFLSVAHEQDLGLSGQAGKSRQHSRRLLTFLHGEKQSSLYTSLEDQAVAKRCLNLSEPSLLN